MAKRILAWECRYCGKIKKTEIICLRHEKACLSNPDAHNCLMCGHHTGRICDKRGCMCSTAVSAKCEHFRPQTEEELLNSIRIYTSPIDSV